MSKGFRAASAGATLVIAATAILTSFSVAGPVVSPDEYGYLSGARALAGRGRLLVLPGVGSYPWGYPLLLSPLAAAFGSARDLHRAALLLNSLLLAALVPLGIAVLARLGYSPWAALGGALIVATHPSLFTYAHLVFSENLFVPLQALVLVALVSLVGNGSNRAAVSLGVALAAGSFVRLNGIATAIAGIATLGLLALRRESRRSAAVSLAALVAGVAALAGLGGLLLPGFRPYGGLSRSGVLSRAMADPLLLLQTVVGQFVSISLSSWLLLPLLLGVAARLAIHRARHPRVGLEGWEAGVLCAAAASVGTLLMGAVLLHDNRLDYRIYARYGEGLLPLIVWGGAAALRHKRTTSLLILPTFFGLLTLAFLARPPGDRPLLEIVGAPAAPVLFFPVQVWGLRNLPLVTAIVATPMAAGWWLLDRGSRVGVWATGIAMQLLVGLGIVADYVVPGSRLVERQTAHLATLEPLGAAAKKVVLLDAEESGWTEGPVSLALPRAEVLSVSSAEAALSSGADVLVARKERSLSFHRDYRLVALQWRGPLATWVRRGIEVRQGTPLYEITLPPDRVVDYRVRFDVSEPIHVRHGQLQLRARVTNIGAGYFPDRGVLLQSPWPMAPVRVGLSFRNNEDRTIGEEGRLELGRPLGPGQQTSLDAAVPVPEGSVDVVLRLLQEGRTAFGPERRCHLDTGSP